MKCLSLLPLSCLLFLLGGCGVTSNSPVEQISLAIYSPLCIDVVDASTASGAPVQVYPCGPGKRSQEWQLITAGSSNGFTLVNVNSQMCMSVSNTPDSAPGQYVIQETCTPSAAQPNQIWNMVKAPGKESGYQLVSAASSQCLDLPYGAVASVFHLQQYYCTANDPAQGWSLTPVAPGNTP